MPGLGTTVFPLFFLSESKSGQIFQRQAKPWPGCAYRSLLSIHLMSTGTLWTRARQCPRDSPCHCCFKVNLAKLKINQTCWSTSSLLQFILSTKISQSLTKSSLTPPAPKYTDFFCLQYPIPTGQTFLHSTSCLLWRE